MTRRIDRSAAAAVRGAVGLRASAEEEVEGLDLGEHGTGACPGFRIAASYPFAGAGSAPAGAARAAAGLATVPGGGGEPGYPPAAPGGPGRGRPGLAAGE